jgi:hypothetical protein
LQQTLQKVTTKMYEGARGAAAPGQPGQGGTPPPPGPGQQPGAGGSDKVVDADFEVVDDKKK